MKNLILFCNYCTCVTLRAAQCVHEWCRPQVKSALGTVHCVYWFYHLLFITFLLVFEELLFDFLGVPVPMLHNHRIKLPKSDPLCYATHITCSAPVWMVYYLFIMCQ